jgi:hypothetical protein
MEELSEKLKARQGANQIVVSCIKASIRIIS